MVSKNKNFGKVIGNGELEYAPAVLVFNGQNVATNDPEKYAEKGFYPINKTKKPVKEGIIYTPFYVQTATGINERWQEHEIEETQNGETATAEEIRAAIAEGVNSIDN